jgi:hypothetical protein
MPTPAKLGCNWELKLYLYLILTAGILTSLPTVEARKPAKKNLLKKAQT